MHRRVAALLGALAALAAVACSSDPGALPEVPDFTPAATTTTGIDFSAQPLKGVTGRSPTTSIVFGPGQATLNGTVIGEDGAIPGATIQVERIVSGSVATMTLLSAEDGTWSLPQILGGRYRIRAWRTPDLAQTSYTATFLNSSETKDVQLRVRTIGGLAVTSSYAPDPPTLGDDLNLVVQVTVKEVDAGGVVRATPQENIRIELLASQGWRIMTANPVTTDARGRGDWTLRCRSTGRQSLAVEVGTQTIPLDVNSCTEITVEETTTTTSDTGLFG